MGSRPAPSLARPAARTSVTAENILVIKLSALGNVVLSLGPFAAIRAHHPRARITLLTTPPYAGWLARAPWFDRVWADGRPPWWALPALARRLRGAGFTRVYDLQTSGRSSRYLRLFPRQARPEWSGIARGASHPDRRDDRDRQHDIDRQFAQLAQAGVTERCPPDLSWATADLAPFGLPARFALLVPGSSAHRPGKRWPVARYAALAEALAGRGLAPVVLGSAGEAALARAIPAARDLTGRTDFDQLAALGRAAALAVGNDTGPMHLLAAAGCPSLVLFSGESDPALCAPRGPDVTVLQRPLLSALTPEEVLAALLSDREEA
jgi:ADP-heptose:LPS heptosyltransferase